MDAAPDGARGGRWSSRLFGRLGRPFCAAPPLTLTSSSDAPSTKAPGVQRPSLGAAAAERSGAFTVVAAAEAGDVLHPLPSLNARQSHAQRFNRSGTSGAGQHASRASLEGLVAAAGIATAAGGAGEVSGKRAAFPSHTLGSLTTWQMLAADVQQEMEEGPAGLGRGSEGSEHPRLSASSSRNRSSQAEPGPAMSEGLEVEEAHRRSSSMLYPHHQHPPQQAQPQQQPQQAQVQVQVQQQQMQQVQVQQQEQEAKQQEQGAKEEQRQQRQQQQQLAASGGSSSSSSSAAGQLASDGSLKQDGAAAVAAVAGAPVT